MSIYEFWFCGNPGWWKIAMPVIQTHTVLTEASFIRFVPNHSIFYKDIAEIILVL